MDHLHWPLSVLGKAIHHKNLSAAANHIGLSQPQLSRLIAKLEEELGVVLLDRTARRKSGWTPVAYRVADLYFRSSRKLQSQLQELQGTDQVQHIHVGTLEGLVPLAVEVCKNLLIETKIPVVELNVYDLSELEERFEKDELDLFLTCREPGKTKHRYVRSLGWQDLTMEGSSRESGLRVMSPFEFAKLIQTGKRNASRREKDETATSRIVVSNSLALRRRFMADLGALGQVPSEVRSRRPGTSTEQPVYMIGHEILPPAVWETLNTMKLTNKEPLDAAARAPIRPPVRALPKQPRRLETI